MSKVKDSMMKSDEKLLERAFRLMEYKYLATKYKQDMKHRAVGGVDVGRVAQMLLQKTKEGSQFYRFHNASEVAKTIFTVGVPAINSKRINVLQVLFVEDKNYNMIIEFEYIEKESE